VGAVLSVAVGVAGVTERGHQTLVGVLEGSAHFGQQEGRATHVQGRHVGILHPQHVLPLSSGVLAVVVRFQSGPLGEVAASASDGDTHGVVVKAGPVEVEELQQQGTQVPGGSDFQLLGGLGLHLQEGRHHAGQQERAYSSAISVIKPSLSQEDLQYDSERSQRGELIHQLLDSIPGLKSAVIIDTDIDRYATSNVVYFYYRHLGIGDGFTVRCNIFHNYTVSQFNC